MVALPAHKLKSQVALANFKVFVKMSAHLSGFLGGGDDFGVIVNEAQTSRRIGGMLTGNVLI